MMEQEHIHFPFARVNKLSTFICCKHRHSTFVTTDVLWWFLERSVCIVWCCNMALCSICCWSRCSFLSGYWTQSLLICWIWSDALVSGESGMYLLAPPAPQLSCTWVRHSCSHHSWRVGRSSLWRTYCPWLWSVLCLSLIHIWRCRR